MEAMTDTRAGGAKTAREAFSGMEDTSCQCLLDPDLCISLDVSEPWEWEARSFSCEWTSLLRNKAICYFEGRSVGVKSGGGTFTAGSAIVTRLDGRGWCFDGADARENYDRNNGGPPVFGIYASGSERGSK